MARHFLNFASLPSNKALQPFFKQNGQSLHSISHVTDVEHAKEFLRQNALTTYHSVGSAAMLPNKGRRGAPIRSYGAWDSELEDRRRQRTTTESSSQFNELCVCCS